MRRGGSTAAPTRVAVDLLDITGAVLHRLDGVCQLRQPAAAAEFLLGRACGYIGLDVQFQHGQADLGCVSGNQPGFFGDHGAPACAPLSFCSFWQLGFCSGVDTFGLWSLPSRPHRGRNPRKTPYSRKPPASRTKAPLGPVHLTKLRRRPPRTRKKGSPCGPSRLTARSDSSGAMSRVSTLKKCPQTWEPGAITKQSVWGIRRMRSRDLRPRPGRLTMTL